MLMPKKSNDDTLYAWNHFFLTFFVHIFLASLGCLNSIIYFLKFQIKLIFCANNRFFETY